VTNFDVVEYILTNSPFIFGPGKLKVSFFNNFMPDNLGISFPDKWKSRRTFNERILNTDKKYHDLYPNIQKIVSTELLVFFNSEENINFENLTYHARNIAMEIIFGYKDVKIYEIFTDTNSISKIIFSEKKTHCIISEYISKSTRKNSFISLITDDDFSKDDILKVVNQVPHWLFPMTGLINVMFLRMLYLLFTSDWKCPEINSLDDPILDNIVFESLRLNNPVLTFFRKCLEKTKFKIDSENDIIFEKDEEILILSNPLLRDPNIFKDPNTFNPDRWKDSSLFRYLIMFGLSHQTCPGKNLSLLILKISLLTTLSHLKDTGKKIQFERLFPNNDIYDTINVHKIKSI